MVIKKKLAKIFLIIVIFEYIYLGYFYDNKVDVKNYGGGVSIIMQTFFLLIWINYGFFYFYCKIYKKNTKSTIVFSFIIIFGFVLVTFMNLYASCKGWEKGINNLEIDDTKSKC
jgi:hypothetical protein